MRKTLLVLLFVALASIFVRADTDFYLFGRGNFIHSIGDESDYREGENDFPLASSHQTYGLGGGVSYSKGMIAVGLEVNYNLSGKTTLTDPSDSDTVKIDTYRNLACYLTLGLNLIKRPNIQFFINGGGGVSSTLGTRAKIYTSRLGYETRIEPPEKKYHFSGFGGVGFELFFSSRGGLLLSGRYLYVAFEQPQTMFVALAGLVLRF